MSVTQGLRRAKQTHAQGIACKWSGGERTWEEVHHRVQCFASGLRELGVVEGDRVGILSLNSPYYYEALYAIPWAGAVTVPLNYRLSVPELAFQMKDAGIKALVFDETLRPMAEALKSSSEIAVQLIALEETEDNQYVQLEELISASSPMDDAGRTGSDLYGLFYTGGTTGRPKGVMLTHDNIVANAVLVSGIMLYGPHTNYLHAAPMFHAADCGSTFAITMEGGTHSFISKFTPKGVLDAINQWKVQVVMLVPTMLRLFLDQPDLGEQTLPDLSDFLYGASPMPEALLKRLVERFPDKRFTQCLGMTEMSPIITVLTSDRHVFHGPLAGKTQSAGQVALTVEAKVVDENENELPRGEVGELLVKGPMMMAGYWQLESETQEALRGGWLHTGDGAYMDEDGFVYVVDRVKDMVITGGENVYSLEVENVIYQHPSVAECAVIGVPDSVWGEAVHAIIVLKEGQSLSEKDLIAHCKKSLAGYKCPRSVSFRTEPLPLSGAGKVLKSALREGFQSALT